MIKGVVREDNLMPKIVDHAQKKMEIAAAACSTIFKMGFEKAKLIDIGKKAGCTTGAITHYFSDKNEVLIAAWDYAYTDLMKQMEDASNRKPYSLIEVLSQSLPINMRSKILTKVWMMLAIRSLDNTSLAKKQISISRLWNKRIEKELRKAQRLGEVEQQINLEFESKAISIVINGICLRAIIDPKSYPAKQQLKLLHNHVDRLMPEQNKRLGETIDSQCSLVG